MAQGLTGLTQWISGAGSDEDIYGRKPIVPNFPSYSAALREITQGNLAALPSLQKLGIKSTKAYSEMMEAAYPGTGELKDLGMNAIKGFLTGKVPGFDEYAQRRGAELSRESGTAGSGFGFGQELNFSFNELAKLTKIGLDTASQWIEQARSQTFDFSKMFLGPQDAIRQVEGRWSRDWLANQVEAAPDPVSRGIFDSEMAWIGMVLSAYGGGPGYTQGYRQNYGGAGTGAPAGRSGTSYFGGVQNYGYGQTPPNTSYDPRTDQSTYDPFGEFQGT